MSEKYWPETIVLWGAGATRSVGLHATRELIQLVFKTIQNDFSFLQGKDKNLVKYFKKLITYDLIKDEKLSEIYDLKALEIIMNTNTKFNIHELFTMLDQLIDNNKGFNAFFKGKSRFLRVERIRGAKRCLILIIEEIERISVQDKPGYFDKAKIEPYYKLSKILTELMVEEAKEFDRRGYKRDTRKFYLCSCGIISFNWDPILLWNLYNAHKEENIKEVKLDDGMILQLFNDFGTQIAIDRRNSKDSEICYGIDEPTCKGVNNYNYPSRIFRVGKILFPHGMFGSRICPECGKFILSFSESYSRLSTEIFGPSLLKELQIGWNYKTEKEKVYTRGAIECPYCGQITYPYDMPIIMQSMEKDTDVLPLYEIKMEMGLLIKNAKHIVFLGYSLPMDDIMVKTFFMSCISASDRKKLKCTVVNHDTDYIGSEKWLEGEEIVNYIDNSKNKSTVGCIKNICDIFDIQNIRVSLKGIPDIFMQNKNCTKQKIIDLLYPRKYFKEGFPVKR